MSDSAMVVVAIFLATIIMFVFPLMTMAEKKDDVTEITIQTATDEFVGTIRTTGKLTQEDYSNFVSTLGATGNAYNVDMTIQVLDFNPAKKTVTSTATIGDNVYFTKYTSQIEAELNANDGVMLLKEGDIVSVTVKNANNTVAGQLRNFFYKVTGDNSSTIASSSSGIVTANGNN